MDVVDLSDGHLHDNWQLIPRTSSNWRSSYRPDQLALVVSYIQSQPHPDPILMPYSFFINLPCGAIAAASMALFFRVPKAVKLTESTPEEKILQMDIPGFLLVLAAVVCYLLAMQWGGAAKSRGSAGVIGALVGSVVAFIAFLAVEYFEEQDHIAWVCFQHFVSGPSYFYLFFSFRHVVLTFMPF
jgi:hypothetical protein